MLRKLLRTVPSLVVFACVIFSSASAWAQASIVGLVKDESGAVLPGVTVEAASPALIEGEKAVATDDQGRYRFEALRPGPYKLTFSLSGFTTLTRTGVDVPSDIGRHREHRHEGRRARGIGDGVRRIAAGRRHAGVANAGADA